MKDDTTEWICVASSLIPAYNQRLLGMTRKGDGPCRTDDDCSDFVLA